MNEGCEHTFIIDAKRFQKFHQEKFTPYIGKFMRVKNDFGKWIPVRVHSVEVAEDGKSVEWTVETEVPDIIEYETLRPMD